ncbi:hypothetical protein L1987_24939 [Smallanthus sonchifolius]|uniref:Uncharacterized protein n=1 Tax=Smallanthus sonchifolius TaxID=185202 RepID=A0ACB9INA7_9ASTR|nr:hypothetical protein L1987_24939 [Smallanthus sonchifolius]
MATDVTTRILATAIPNHSMERRMPLQWITSMEAVIKMSECRSDKAVKFAAHSFEEDAIDWWESVKQTKIEAVTDRMTWEDLKNLIMKMYCLQNVVDKIESEFMWFEAGTMTHQEYTTKFNEMAKLVPHLIWRSKRVL